jgi:RNA polymerase sigma-70 factor (ECF subfamily)
MTSRPHLRLVASAPAPALVDAYRQYSPFVAAVVYRLLGRDHDVDDVVQDVFVAAASGLSRIREPGALKGWLATVAVRLSMRRLRWRRMRGFLGLDASRENDIAANAVDPADRVLLAKIYALLDQVPAAERSAWVLHRIEGETLPAVAEMCECSLATVKRRIERVQRKIEENLT